jgi:hypothetical protein
MLNDETGSNLQDTRALGASTPTHNLGGRTDYDDPEEHIRKFLMQEGALDFGHKKAYYAHLLEEKDDAFVRWYPMYISYGREKRALDIQEALKLKGYDTYLHLQEVPKDQFGNPREGTLLGPLYSMVFVQAMKIQLKLLKRYAANCNLMKFVTRRNRYGSQDTQIIWVPEKQMENFIKAATCPDPDSQRIPLTYNEFIDREGKKVKIMKGPFTGVEGEIKRVCRHRIVVALLRDVKIAVGITHIPPEDLIFV